MAAAQPARGVAIAEAARRLGVDEDAIRIWIQTRSVEGVQVDGVWHLALPDGADEAAPAAAGDGADGAAPVIGAAEPAAHPDVAWLREQLAARDRTIAALTERIVDLAGRPSAPPTAPPGAAFAKAAPGGDATPPESIVALKASLDNLVALTRPAGDDGDGIAADGWRAGASRWTARSGSIWVFFTAVLSVVVYAALAVADVMKGVGVVVNGGHMQAATTLAGLLAIPATLWMNRPASARATTGEASLPRR